MAGEYIPAQLTDLFGGVINYNLRDDGDILASYQSPWGWRTQDILTPQEILDALYDEAVADRARAAWHLHFERLKHPKPQYHYDYSYYDDPSTWSGMDKRGPDWSREQLNNKGILRAAALLHSPGYAAYVDSVGGITEAKGHYVYVDRLNAYNNWLTVHERKKIEVRRQKNQALAVVGGLMFSGLVGSILGALASSSGGDDSVIEPAPEESEYSLLETSIEDSIFQAYNGGNDAAYSVGGDIIDAANLDTYDAALALDNTESGLTGSIGSLVSGASSILKTVVGSVISGVQSTAGEAGGQLVSVLQVLAAGLHDVVSTVQSYLQPILTPIKDAMSITSGAIRDLNDNLIRPIFGTITALQRNYEALTKSIDRNLGEGIEGIMRLSQDFTNALTSAESAMVRGLQQLGANNESLARGALRDTLGETVGLPLSGIAAALQSRVERDGTTAEPSPLLRLGENTEVNDMLRYWSEAVTKLRGYKGLWEPVIDGVVTLLEIGPFMMGYLKAGHDAAYAAGRGVYQGERLSPADALEAGRRKIIDDASMTLELKAAGFSDERIKALKELSDRTFTATEATELWRRGLIDQATRDDLLLRVGIEAHHVDKVVALGERVKALSVVIAEYSLLESAGATGVLGPAEMTAPDAVVAQGLETGESITTIHAAWRLQWSLPSVPSATQLYFRNLITLEQLFAFYDVANIPKSLHWVILEGQRQLIPARTAISMHKAGIVDAGRMSEIIAAAGYSPADAELLIAFAGVEDKAPPKETADALHGLTQSTIISLYDAGTIERSTALSLLIQIGIGTEAAELALLLVDLRDQQEERKATTDLIVAEVEAGALSIDDAQAALLGAGLTTVEMEKAYTRILRATRAKSKLPGLADLGRMWKRQIVSDAEYVATVRRLGYSEIWAGRLFESLKAGDLPEGAI